MVIEQTVKNRTHWAGFFPFQITGSRWSSIGQKLQLWVHNQCYLTTPLIAAGQEHDVLDRVLAYLKIDRSLPSLMHWPLALVGGPIGQALIDIARRDLLTVCVNEAFNRASLHPWSGDDSEEACHEYLLRSLGGHHLREIRRQRRRLSEAGDIEFRTLQVRGGKTIHLYDGRDRTLLTEQNLEGFYSDKHRNLKIDEARIDEGWKFDLQPGMGLHFPVTYPHWVQNQDEVSISFSITFRTPDLDRRRSLYSINHSLREKGYSPTPVGKNNLRDMLYDNLFRLYRKLKSKTAKPCDRTCTGTGM